MAEQLSNVQADMIPGSPAQRLSGVFWTNLYMCCIGAVAYFGSLPVTSVFFFFCLAEFSHMQTGLGLCLSGWVKSSSECLVREFNSHWVM